MQRLMGRAISRYGLIEHQDRIAVALSGGKDSFSLLSLLKDRLKRIPIHYELIAIHLDMGFAGNRPDLIQEFCETRGVAYYFEKTDYGVRAHGPENKENPCFLCSWLRRKRLFELSKPLGFSKIALGHNKDDIIETLFLNMFFSGELATMLPKQLLFKGELTIIRPLALLEEKTIKAFAERQGLPEVINPCPSALRSSRQEVKTLLKTLYAGNRKIKGNIFRALSNVRLDYLLPAGLNEKNKRARGKKRSQEVSEVILDIFN